MNSKTVILGIVACLIGNHAYAGSGDGTDGTPEVSGPAYKINEAKSTLFWEGYKPGGKHFGTVEVVEGVVHSDGNRVTGGSFLIDMNSIRNSDIKGEGSREKLVGHLKSGDFFDVENHPTAMFEITGITVAEGTAHMITGDLTLRGNTNQITFPAEITMDKMMIHAQTGEIRLDRTAWGVNHMSKSVFSGMKDRFIDDEMVIRLDLHFDR